MERERHTTELRQVVMRTEGPIGEFGFSCREPDKCVNMDIDMRTSVNRDKSGVHASLGRVSSFIITLLGDLKNGRTVHSLVTLLCHYSVRLNFVAPASLSMPVSVVSAARKAGVSVHQCESLEEVLPDTDVLYVTRIQKERFANESEWQKVKDSYRVDHALLARAKEDMIVMHPLPRVNEIDPEVDFDSRRAVYFRQMRYGLFIRMALLASVLGSI